MSQYEFDAEAARAKPLTGEADWGPVFPRTALRNGGSDLPDVIDLNVEYGNGGSHRYGGPHQRMGGVASSEDDTGIDGYKYSGGGPEIKQSAKDSDDIADQLNSVELARVRREYPIANNQQFAHGPAKSGGKHEFECAESDDDPQIVRNAGQRLTNWQA